MRHTLLSIAFVATLFMPARAADPVRGEQLFMTPPRPGQLICADCHSDAPLTNNFGNIWSGRNAVALIQRAVQINTGGMGVFQSLFTPADFADIAAYLGNAPNRLRFAETPQGATSVAQRVTIASSLKQGIEGLSLGVEGDYVIAASRCGNAVPRFDECSVDVAFRPTGEGQRPGTLVIAHAGTPTPVRVPLEGHSPRVPRAVAAVTPAALDFGSAALGSDGALRHAVVANSSSDALTLLGISSSAEDFVIAGGSCVAGQRLTTGQRCIVALRFTPRSGGQRSGALNLAHDGVGGMASVALQGDVTSSIDERLRSDSMALDFGSVLPGQRSAERLVVWTQAGNDTLAAVPAQTSDARFVVTEHRCSGAVAPWQRCETRLQFVPVRAVASSGELRIGQTLRVSLFGRSSGGGELLAEPAVLGFDEGVGLVQVRSVALRNVGTGPLRLNRLALLGTEVTDFALDGASACREGMALAPAQSCQLALRFSPLVVGQKRAQLRVDSDAGTRAVELVGQAYQTPQPQASSSAAVLDFGVVPVGAAARELPLVVRNEGRIALRWATLAVAGGAAPAYALSGRCASEAVVAPGADCSLRVRLDAATAGRHDATLVLWPTDAGQPLVVALRAQIVAAGAVSDATWPASASTAGATPLQADPSALVFEAVVGQAAPAQSIVLHNAGNRAWLLSALASTGAAFELDPGECRPGMQALMPGESCRASVRWSGQSPGPAATIQAAGDDAAAIATIALQISEDPAQRSNVGTGAGSSSAGWLALLALAAFALQRQKRLQRPAGGVALKQVNDDPH